MGYFTLCPNGTYYDFYITKKYSENFIFFTKSLIDEFNPILSAHIYRNTGKRMLVEHSQDSLASGHFDGNETNEGVSLIKKTDEMDYQKDGLGESAKVKTQQVSKFDKNGTLIESTSNSKVELNLENPKNLDEKNYQTNITNNNSTNEKERNYNETIRKQDPIEKNQTISMNKELNGDIKQNNTNLNKTENNNTKISNSTENNETINDTNSSLENNTTSNETINQNNTNNNNLNETNQIQQFNQTNDFNNNKTNENGFRLLNQDEAKNDQKQDSKRKLIQESEDSFKLVMNEKYDEFYKNISTIFYQFEYDENDKAELEELADPDKNSTELDKDDLDTSLENSTNSIEKDPNQSQNSTQSNEIEDNNNNQTIITDNSKNNTIIDDNSKNFTNANQTKHNKTTAFMLFSEYQKKFNQNSTNEETSNLPDSKDLRILISSNLLDDKHFKMNILRTNILGISINLHADVSLRTRDNKIEFRLFLTVLGLKIHLYETNMDIKINEALRTLLMYNENLLNQILSITSFNFAKSVEDFNSIKENILKKIELKNIKLEVLSAINQSLPTMRDKIKAFSDEFKTFVESQFNKFHSDIEEHMKIKFENDFGGFQKDIVSIVNQEIKQKENDIKIFINEAKNIYKDISNVPKSIYDRVVMFRSNLKEEFRSQIKQKIFNSTEKYLTIIKKDIISSSQSALNSLDLLIRERSEEYEFLDNLKCYNEMNQKILESIKSACDMEKKKLLDYVNNELDIIIERILEDKEVHYIFNKIELYLDVTIKDLKDKINSSETASMKLTEDCKIFESLVNNKIPVLSKFLITIEMKENIDEINPLILSIRNKINNIITNFKSKSSNLVNDVSKIVSDCLNNQRNFLQSFETIISDFYQNAKQKIFLISQQMEEFINHQSNRFQNGIFSTTIQKGFLSNSRQDLLSEIINGVKNFENLVDNFKPKLIESNIEADVHYKVTDLQKTLVEGLVYTESEIVEICKIFEDLFTNEGQKLLKSFFTKNIFKDLKFAFKDTTKSIIASNFIAFKDKFKIVFERFLTFKNLFKNFVNSAKNKISSLISIDYLNLNKPIISKNFPTIKVRHPIQILFFLFWVEARFGASLKMNIFSKANLSGIELGFDLNLSSTMTGSAYVDLYVINGGVYAYANLVELNSITSASYNFLTLGGNLKSCGSIKYLNVRIGVFVRYLRKIIIRRCFIIRLWFRRIRICIYRIIFYMSPYYYLVNYIRPYSFSKNFCFLNSDF